MKGRGGGLAAVQGVGLDAAPLHHGVRSLAQGRQIIGGPAGCAAIDVHGQIVVPPQHADGAAGIGVVDLPPGIVVRRHVHAVVDQHRAEGHGEQHVVFRQELFRLRLGLKLMPIRKQHIAVTGNIAGVAGHRVEAADLPLIDADAAVAVVVVKIAAHRQHGVGVHAEVRGGLKVQVEHLVAGDLAPQLRAVRHKHLGKGTDRFGLHLLPDEHQEGIIHVIADRVRVQRDIRIPDQLLSVDQALGGHAAQQLRHLRRICCLPEKGRRWDRATDGVFIQRLVGLIHRLQLRRGGLIQGVRQGVRIPVHLRAQILQRVERLVLPGEPTLQLRVPVKGHGGLLPTHMLMRLGQPRLQSTLKGPAAELRAIGAVFAIDLIRAQGFQGLLAESFLHLRVQTRRQLLHIQRRNVYGLLHAAFLGAAGVYGFAHRAPLPGIPTGLVQGLSQLRLRLRRHIRALQEGDVAQLQLWYFGNGDLVPHVEITHSPQRDQQQDQQDGQDNGPDTFAFRSLHVFSSI